ncbi:MAG: hypothetical protein AB7I96_13540 [Candidatus Dadabacteria bacterium]
MFKSLLLSSISVVSLIITFNLANATGGIYTTVRLYFACGTKTDIIKIMNYARVKDQPAAEKLVNSGRCTILKGGDEVQLMSSYTEDGMEYVEVRPMGQEVTIWTIRKGIE